jgi:hypothetical protein
MIANLLLDEGDELLCAHCRRWHPVTGWHTQGTSYTQAMLSPRDHFFSSRPQLL